MSRWRDDAAPRRARPPQVAGALARPRLAQALTSARVLLVTATAGYGKTTTLATHLEALGAAAWLTLDPDDHDPRVLASGLALALSGLPGADELGVLHDQGAAPLSLARRAARLLEEQRATLVVDEAQHAAHGEAAAVLRALLGARVALLSRTPLDWPELTALELGGEARRLEAAELAFTPDELAALMQANRVQLTGPHLRAAHRLTEGWPIAARFLAQALRQGRISPGELDTLDPHAQGLGTLFSYLAREVLGPLDENLRVFLTRSSVFEDLSEGLLTQVLDEPNAGAFLAALAGGGTFLTRAGDTFRAHPLLRAWLRAQLSDDDAVLLARRGAAHYEHTGRPRRAVAAHLQGQQPMAAARLLALHGRTWLRAGRGRMVERALVRLPGECWAEWPALYTLLGDTHRAASRYPEALEAYRRAPHPDGPLGQVQVYLDTVQPALAGELLQDLRLREADPGVVDRMQAENALNAGQLERALQLDPALALSARYALRRGDLQRALLLARQAASGEVGERTAGNHREALLLDSFLSALLGEPHDALDRAAAGQAEGERLESPFVRALARTRQGHALLAAGHDPPAETAYRSALEEAQGIAPRLTVEAHMGLAYLEALAGQDGGHRPAALHAAGHSGDRYMCGLARFTAALGTVHRLQRRTEAPDPATLQTLHAQLDEAAAEFLACGDTFGQDAVQLARFAAGVGPALPALLAAHRAPFLLSRPSLLAPARRRAGRARVLSALRVAARREQLPWTLQGIEAALGYPSGVPDSHPGHEVQVQLLGQLSLRVAGHEVREWGRAKARDLLTLLAVTPGGLARDAAQEALFPDSEPGVGERNLRVTLHALGALLEAGAPSGFFLDRGEWLRLRPGPDLQVDLHGAEALLAQPPGTPGRSERLLRLPSSVTDSVLEAVQAAAARYASALPPALAAEGAAALAAGQALLAETLADHALRLDPAEESAARVLMRARYQLGVAAGVHRAYTACCGALGSLGLTPLPETVALYRALTSLAP
ncbi:AAA family ATPase [Deinococcus sonorensis]|uniref:AAA family ATPase n=1 Tax=Deinococcus sonorensis KR-87 TaxID=694439 RepID=A0AAU7U5N3_9DEIO